MCASEWAGWILNAKLKTKISNSADTIPTTILFDKISSLRSMKQTYIKLSEQGKSIFYYGLLLFWQC